MFRPFAITVALGEMKTVFFIFEYVILNYLAYLVMKCKESRKITLKRPLAETDSLP